jgi:L-rhamnose mutarotase
MQRVGFLLQVKKDKIEEYKKHHEAVWPEMLAALRRTGWRNYSLFLRDDGLLFGYFEAEESFQASLEGMAKEEINLRWQEFMGPYFEAITGRPDQSMIHLEEVFHTD